MTAITLSPPRLGASYKFIWGLAAFGTALISGTFAALLPIFYQDYLGLAARWIAIGAAIYAIWNAINDPLFGYITDSTRSKRGRRIPYMRFTAPFLALTFILVWLAPKGARQPALFAWMLGAMLLYDTCYTIIGLAYSALLPEVTESDADRTGLQVSGSLFGLLGMLLGFIIPELFRPKAGTSPSVLPLQIAMIVVGVVSALLIIATTLKVKERPEFTRVDKPLGVGPAIRFTFTSRSFLILAAANFMSILMQSLLLGTLFYLADYVLQMNSMIVLAAVFIPLIIGVPVSDLIRARLGVVRTQQLLLVIGGVALMLLTVVPGAADPGLPGAGRLWSGRPADADQRPVCPGGRRGRAAVGGAPRGRLLWRQRHAHQAGAVVGPDTDAVHSGGNRLHHRGSNAGQITLNQPASALFGIRSLMGLIPGAAMILGALILLAYPLRGKYLAKIQSEVLALHADKHARLEAQ